MTLIKTTIVLQWHGIIIIIIIIVIVVKHIKLQPYFLVAPDATIVLR